MHHSEWMSSIWSKRIFTKHEQIFSLTDGTYDNNPCFICCRLCHPKSQALLQTDTFEDKSWNGDITQSARSGIRQWIKTLKGNDSPLSKRGSNLVQIVKRAKKGQIYFVFSKCFLNHVQKMKMVSHQFDMLCTRF